MKRIVIICLTMLLCSLCLAAQAEPQYRIAALTSDSVYQQIEYAPDGTCASMTEYETLMTSDGYKVLKNIIRFDAAGNIISVETNDLDHDVQVIGRHSWQSVIDGRTIIQTYQNVFMEADFVMELDGVFSVHIIYYFDGADCAKSSVSTVVQPGMEPMASETVYSYVFDDHGCPIMQLSPEGNILKSMVWEACE